MQKSVYIIAMALACALLVLPGVNNDALAQLSVPGVGGDLTRLPVEDLAEIRARERLERLERKAERDRLAAEKAAQEAAKAAASADETLDSGSATVAEATQQGLQAVDGTLQTALRVLNTATDSNGATIEQNVIVVLLNPDEVSSLKGSALQIISRRELPALGLTMLTLRRTGSTPLAASLQELRAGSPSAASDFNHIYRFASATDVDNTDGPASSEAEPAAAANTTTLRIGVIDSKVMREHRALRDAQIIDNDFASYEGLRPLTHGTAVASLVAKNSGNTAAIFSASVFVQQPGQMPGASAESLVAALDWLVSQDVDVINMSLAGPGNQLLEAAVRALVEKQVVIVAAVGNNGPSGEPLYPAAYAGVIGVTAVDRKERIFRYANRGEQVDYAALGVDLKVADSDSGGWRIESGTSMASPFIAVIIAQTLNSDGVVADALESWLKASAKDLGRKGYDTVYGYGLIKAVPVVVSAN